MVSMMFDWESEEVQQRFKHSIDFLTRGSSCKKRQCHKKSGCGCACVQNSRYCGPCCECQSCLKVPTNDHESEHDASGENDDSGEENEDGVELGGSPSFEEEGNTIIIDEEIITDWDDLFIPL